MKKTLLFLSCSFTLLATAQQTVNISTQQYQLLKQNNQLDVSKRYVFTDAIIPSGPIHFHDNGGQRSPSSICSCMQTLDSTFSVVPFSGALPPDYRNDDMSTNPILFPFTFSYYGINYDSIYINNNGNISFTGGNYAFTSTAFPTSNFDMIAPFWGDVDTRDSASGLVYYKITPSALIVKWEQVGYYAMMSDKVNTFQLIITDGTDPLLPAGDNVGFCYGDMQWTTGMASGGINGFGGTPATVGVNQGDSISYFQIGRFDSTGVAFDGPYGANDKVDWLDNQGIYFNTAVVGNIPPIIINNNICDTIDVFTGDTTLAPFIDSVQFMIGISTPEINQTVTAAFSSSDMANMAYSLTTNTATYKEYTCKFYVAGLPAGLHTVSITATDNGIPAANSTRTVFIRSNFDAGLVTSMKEYNSIANVSIYPNPTESLITVKHNFNVNSNPVLTITNLVGQTIMTQSLTTNEQGIEISKLSKGIYFATIVSKEGKSKTIKIVRK